MPNLSNRLTLLREKQGWSKAETARRTWFKSTFHLWQLGIWYSGARFRNGDSNCNTL